MGRHTIAPDDPALVAFWTERHLCSLTTIRADGTPHVVAVGATLDPEEGLARVITSRASFKARHVAAAGPQGAAVALCQVDGRRWATVEGRALVRADPSAVQEAERRYALRYRTPRPNPERVVLEVRVTRVLASMSLTGS